MTKRVAFFICGVMTVAIGRVYSGLQRFAPTQEIAWLPFSYALLIVGTIAVGEKSLYTQNARNRDSECTGLVSTAA